MLSVVVDCFVLYFTIINLTSRIKFVYVKDASVGWFSDAQLADYSLRECERCLTYLPT